MEIKANNYEPNDILKFMRQAKECLLYTSDKVRNSCRKYIFKTTQTK